MAILAMSAALFLGQPKMDLAYVDENGNLHRRVRGKVEEVQKPKKKWKSVGKHRITYYCPACNSPRYSYKSSSGKRLKEGYVACRWLKNGTRIKIKGNEYVVQDYCGTNAIDIFKDTGYTCHCNQSYSAEVYVYCGK